MEYVAYLGTGILVGLFAGLFGGGTGFISVPALFFIFTHYGILPGASSMHFATGTAVAVSMFCFIGAAARELQNPHAKPTPKLFWLICTSGLLTIIPAILIAGICSAAQLKMVFAIIILATAATLYLPISSHAERRFLNNSVVIFILSGIANILGTLTAAGAGAFILPLLKRMNYEVQQSVGLLIRTGAFVLPFITVGFIILGIYKGFHTALMWGYVYLPSALIVGIISMVVSIFAVKLRQKIPEQGLKLLFFTLLVILGIYMLFLR